MAAEKKPSTGAKKTTSVKKTAVKKTEPTMKPAETPKTKISKPVKAPSESSLLIPVYGLDGKVTKTLELPKELFTVKASPLLIAQYVRVYQANQRQGTASTKRRGEVTGTTKKVYRQKGTGNARHGSKKAPLFVGGGVDSGPKPTDHSMKINKKQRRRALLSVLTQKLQEQGIGALAKDILGMEPKTKLFVNLLKVIGAENKKVMLVVSESTLGVKLAVRNLKKVELMSVSNLNAYNVLTHEKVLFSEDAIAQLLSLYLTKEV